MVQLNMKMPKNCLECRFLEHGYGGMHCLACNAPEFEPGTARPEICPLVDVKPEIIKPWEYSVTVPDAIKTLQHAGWVQCLYNGSPFAIVKHNIEDYDHEWKYSF